MVRQPTRMTRPLQMAVAAYLVFAGLVNMLGALSPETRAAFTTAFRQAAAASPNGSVSLAQAAQFAAAFYAAFVTVVALFSAGQVALAAAGFKRLRWVFWADAVVMGLASFGLLFTLIRLATLTAAGSAVGSTLLSLLGGVYALGVLSAMVVGGRRHGAWACGLAPVPVSANVIPGERR